MKKLLVFALSLALLLSAAAFAESIDYTGVWYLTSLEAEGVTYSPADFGMEMSIEINDNGTATGTTFMGGESETVEGSWLFGDVGITLTLDGDPADFVMEDGVLSAEQDGMKMVFSREKPEVEAFVPAAPKADTAVEDYAGSWTAVKVCYEGNYLDTSVLGFGVNVTIDGTALTVNGFPFEEATFETEFADGALSYTIESSEEEMISGVSARLLEDDTISFTITASEEVEFILVRAE